MIGADAHLVMESQQLSESNKVSKSQVSELKQSKEETEKQLDKLKCLQKGMEDLISKNITRTRCFQGKRKGLEKDMSYC
jgi:peptidoglycan hydrolase CwlO-like protein